MPKGIDTVATQEKNLEDGPAGKVRVDFTVKPKTMVDVCDNCAWDHPFVFIDTTGDPRCRPDKNEYVIIKRKDPLPRLFHNGDEVCCMEMCARFKLGLDFVIGVRTTSDVVKASRRRLVIEQLDLVAIFQRSNGPPASLWLEPGRQRFIYMDCERNLNPNEAEILQLKDGIDLLAEEAG